MFTRIFVALAATALLAAGCGGTVTSDQGGDGGTPGDPCGPGAKKCSGNDLLVCGADGTFEVGETCPNSCDDRLGCVVCVPGTGTCAGNVSTMCTEDGSGYVDVVCDPLQGSTCNFETGVCSGECAPQNIGRNYIGCEYYPTVTANEVDNAFTYAIAVSNTSSSPANVHVEGGALSAPLTFMAPPGTVEVRELPWVPQLKACNNAGGALECGAVQEPSSMVAGGAYHLRSDRPVTVYQFSPLDYKIEGSGCGGGIAIPGCSYTNDASLLLPVNAMTGHYVAASYAAWPSGVGPLPGLITITATKDDTQVTIATTANTQAGNGVPAFVPGVAQTLTMNAGDAAQLFTTTGDLTGSVVQATKPVQVIGGHYCTQVPNGITACDHMEESIFPYEALDRQYVVSAPAVPELPEGKVRVVRIVATEPNTVLEYDPPQMGVATSIANGGEFVEIIGTSETFLISANSKILVVEYMEGQAAGGNIGDPAMALAVPVGQYRVDYQFHAPQNYVTLYVNVIAPLGATVLLDGTAIPAPTPIGTSDFGLTRVELAKNGTGNYKIQADEPFGITVYGYGDWTSFWYPGGLDLSPIVVE